MISCYISHYISLSIYIYICTYTLYIYIYLLLLLLLSLYREFAIFRFKCVRVATFCNIFVTFCSILQQFVTFSAFSRESRLGGIENCGASATNPVRLDPPSGSRQAARPRSSFSHFLLCPLFLNFSLLCFEGGRHYS